MMTNKELYVWVRGNIFEALDVAKLSLLDKSDLKSQVQNAIDVLVSKHYRPLSGATKTMLVNNLMDEITGLGPIQPLLEDDTVTDIMVNGASQVYFERFGKISSSEITFVDEAQVFDIAQRIASSVGRRVDESHPMVDARLEDGSRVNIVTKPLAIDGTTISIRKFRKQHIDFEELVRLGTMNSPMATVLRIAAHSRLNILISGGTGSGKTTLLNALSNSISEAERIVTIEDAAELKLQQPHVVRLETRKASIEKEGEITQRELVINSLRMRPDRIILGECRGSEAFEMLQAMNTGHDGSMSTLHANNPRDAISRVESMVMMANLNQPLHAIRRTIVSAVNLIVQVSRMRDGTRKVTHISEVVGLEGDSVVLEDLYTFELNQTQDMEKVAGKFVTEGLMQRSVLNQKANYFGLQTELAFAFRT
ncbi:CpaF family protein [Vibrio nomapromontoriensis]|uniref:CpaF family protein n=1 Tax=Vibrio nomapromontoriensis TaxID=2910246 RepID=UPI003D11158C